MKIRFSPHARYRMLQRGINEETIKHIIQNPDYIRTSFDGRKIAKRKNRECWNVVFIEKDCEIVVISVYPD